MRFLTRVTGRRQPHPEAHGEGERELLEGRIDDWKEDVYVAGGDGAVAPVLPETTAAGLYDEFEHDSGPPSDPAP